MEKIAVVTGASSGLGLAMSRHFRRTGYTVVAVCRHEPPADVADDFIAADLTDAADRERLVAELTRRYGRLDLLVNNAGVGSYATWEELEEPELRRVFDLNFFAPVALTRACLDLLAGCRGTVVNIASVAAHVPVACMGAYNASKAAFRMFSETLRPELVARDIRVVTVCPGRIDTGFSSRAVGGRRPPETPGRTSSSADALARRVANAVAAARREIVYPRWYRPIIAFVRHFPGLNEAANRQIWKL